MKSVFISTLFCVLFAVALATPVVTGVTKVPTTGGFATITGTGFGDFGVSVQIYVRNNGDYEGRVDGVSVESSSETEVIISVGPGSGKNLRSRLGNMMPVKRDSSETYFDFSYEAPVVETISRTDDLEKGIYVTITGQNFGPDEDHFFGVSVANLLTTQSYWVSDTEVVCQLPGGVGSNNHVKVLVGPSEEFVGPLKRDWTDLDRFHTLDVLQSSPPSPFTITYVGPIPAVEACDSEHIGSVNFVVGGVVTVCGSDFAAYQELPVSKRAEPSDEPFSWAGTVTVTVGGVAAEVIDSDEEFVAFGMPTSSALHGAAAVVVNINGVSLSAGSIFYPTSAPVVTHINPTSVTIPAISSSAITTVVTIHGQYFGDDHHSTHRAVTIGQYGCARVQYVSESVLVCTLPTNIRGSNLAVGVMVNGMANNVLAAPVLDTNFADNLGCGPNGAVDTIETEMCNCYSGFAPASGSYSTDCNQAAKCPGQILSSTHIGGSSPSRPHTTFLNDKLTLVQTSPIVHGRRDFHIRLVAQNVSASEETCNYPGPIWTKTVSSLDCLDVYTLTLPWTQHGMCGFAEVAGDVQFDTFASTLVSEFRDIVNNNGVKSVRFGTTSHLVIVRFQRQLTIALESTHIAPIEYDEGQIDIQVTENALYDPKTRFTYIVFNSIITSPYQITSFEGYWHPSADNTPPTDGAVVIVATLETPQPGDLVCGRYTEECAQRWSLRLQTVDEDGVCVSNLKGKIDLVPTVLCRDPDTTPAACPSSAPTPANATIMFSERTDLCEDSEDDVDASAGLDFTVTTFEDEAFATQQNTFQSSDVAYFQIAVADSQGTIDGITFHSVKLTHEDSGATDPLFDVEDADVYHPAAMFNITSELRKERDAPLSPGSIAILSFRITLSRQLTSLSALSVEDSAPLSVEIVADIQYHGNNKRTMVFAQNNVQKTSVAKLVIVGGSLGNDEIAEVEEVDFSLSLDGSASTASFSLFVMFAVAILAFVLL